jgi:hypothetical protein
MPPVVRLQLPALAFSALLIQQAHRTVGVALPGGDRLQAVRIPHAVARLAVFIGADGDAGHAPSNEAGGKCARCLDPSRPHLSARGGVREHHVRRPPTGV